MSSIAVFLSTFSPESPDATSPTDSVPATDFDSTSATVDRANDHKKEDSAAEGTTADDTASDFNEKAADLVVKKMQSSSSSSSSSKG